MKCHAHACVSLLETLILAHHLGAAFERLRSTTPADALQAWTARLLADDLVGPGELLVMHQRAQAQAADTVRRLQLALAATAPDAAAATATARPRAASPVVA